MIKKPTKHGLTPYGFFGLQHRGGLRMLILVAFMLFLGGGCSVSGNRGWYCYDEEGHPLPDVLFTCRYIGSTLMGYYSAGVNYRLSDADGLARFGSDKVTRKMGWTVDMKVDPEIYSARMHNNDPEREFRVRSAGQNILAPISSRVVEQGVKCILYFKDNSNDPIKWHKSLRGLLANMRCIRDRSYRWDGVGIAELQTVIIPFAQKERTLFLSKYGETDVPHSYIEAWVTLSEDCPGIPRSQWATLKFKDVTPF